MLRVTIQEKNGQREELSFENNPNKELIIGRVPTNEIPLPKNNVSKRHAKVVWNHGSWEIQDLKSTNGTFVNGQQVEHHRLANGDQVIIGDFLLMFDMAPSAPAMNAPQPSGPSTNMPSQPPTMGGPMNAMGGPSMGRPPGPPMAQPPGMPMGMPMAQPPGPGMGMPPGPGMGMPMGQSPGMPMGQSPGMPMGQPPGMPMGQPPGMPMGQPSGMPPNPGMGMSVPPPSGMGGTGGFPPGPMVGRPSAPPTFGGAMPPSSAAGFPSAPGRMPNAGPPVPPPTIPPLGAVPGIPAPVIPSIPTPSAEQAPPKIPSHTDMPGQAMPSPARHAPMVSNVSPEVALEAATPAPPTQAPSALAQAAMAAAIDTVSPEALAEHEIAESADELAQQVAQALEESRSALHASTHSSLDGAQGASATPPPKKSSFRPSSQDQDIQPWIDAIHTLRQKLQAQHSDLTSRLLDASDPQRQQLFKTAQKLAQERIKQHGNGWDAEALAEAAVQETVGWGPLENLLGDESISAIFVNGFQNITIERHGEQIETELLFSGSDALQQTVERILAPQGIRIHRNNPVVETRLQDGTWVHVLMPPIASRGISLVVQPPRSHWMDLDDLLETQFLDANMAHFLQICVQNRCNLLISGDPGSGRTTLLRALAEQISGTERIVTVENVPEIQLEHPHWISLVAQPADLSGNGGVSGGDLVSHALRIRTQRLILGDLQGDMLLQLLPHTTLGLNGVMTTTRANSPDQLIDRLSTVLSGSHPGDPHQQIGQSFDIVIQVNQFACGTRKITSINELSVTHEGNLLCQEIFSFTKQGTNEHGQIQGYFAPTGVIPFLYQKLAGLGQNLDTSIFAP